MDSKYAKVGRSRVQSMPRKDGLDLDYGEVGRSRFRVC